MSKTLYPPDGISIMCEAHGIMSKTKNMILEEKEICT